MPNLTPVSSFDDVPELETSTLALGGPGGPMNLPQQALLNRTQWLHDNAVAGSSSPYVAAAGTANAITATYTPAITALADGLNLRFEAAAANTGAATFSPNGLTAYPVLGSALQVLQGGEIATGGEVEVVWNAALTSWVIVAQAGGSLQVADAAQSHHAVSKSQLDAQATANSTTYTAIADLASTAAGKGSKLVAFIRRVTGAVSRWVEDKLAERASVLDYGADPTGAADSTAAFAAACLDPCKRIYVPAGTYKLANSTVPSGVTLFGEGAQSNIVPLTTAAGNVLQFATGASDAAIHDLGFTIPVATYPNTTAVYGDTNTRCEVRNLVLTGGGFIAVKMLNTTDCKVLSVSCNATANCAVWLTGTANTRSSIRDCSIDNSSGTSAAISIDNGFGCDISRNKVSGAGVFAYHLNLCNQCSVLGNWSYETVRESVNLQDSSYCLVDSNVAVWSGTVSLDFGMSIYASTAAGARNNTISNNLINGPGSAGICVDGSIFNASYNSIVGNTIQRPNQRGAGNAFGIYIYGPNATSASVFDNTIFDDTSKITYGISDVCGTARINNNRVSGATIAEITKVSTSTEALNVDGYRTYTPVVTSSTGTITTATATGKYYEMGKMVFFEIEATITTNGTGAGNVRVSLPFTVGPYSGTIFGREQALTGSALGGVISSGGTVAGLFTYNNTYPGGTGANLIVSGFYQRA